MNVRSFLPYMPVAVLLCLAWSLTVLPVQAQDPDLRDLEQRISKIEKRLEEAEGDQLPWDRYVDEFGGRIMNDWTVVTSSDNQLESEIGALEDGTEFRRVRLFVEGSIGEAADYKLQLDFAGGTEFKDVYLNFNDILPFFGDLKVGHFKEPFSLEEQTSSKYITFMARGAVGDAFSPARSSGFAVYKEGARWQVGLGAFRNDTDGFGESPNQDGEYNLTIRASGAPIHSMNGMPHVLHIGGSYVNQSNQGGAVSFDVEPEVHDTRDFVNTGTISNVDDGSIYGLELAWVRGPLSLQGEWMENSIGRTTGPDVDLDGYYAFVSYFLTGEHRPYDVGAGDFGRPKPHRPFVGSQGFAGGPGAWEVAARFSNLDFTDADGVGLFDSNDDGVLDTSRAGAGEMDMITLGVNWYLHSHSRIMFNYVDADVDNVGAASAISGDAQYITTRFQLDF